MAKPFPGQALPRLAHTLLAAFASLAVLYSAAFMWRHRAPQAFFDLWFSVADFARWKAGAYTLHDLLAPHSGAHRIVTARLLLLLDGQFFQMGGTSVLLVNFALLLATGLLLWRLAGRDGAASAGQALPAPFFLALATATCQCENLIFPFQVQFAITACCVAAATLALTRATTPAAPHPLRSAALAGLLLAIADFSVGAGVIATPCLMLMLALRRGRPALWAAFLPLPLLAGAAYFHHLPHEPPPPLLSAAFTLMRLGYVGDFLAMPLTGPGYETQAAWVGLACLALFTAATLAAILRALRRRAPVPEGEAAMIALGGFVIACALSATLTIRLTFPNHPALVSRYATLGVIFIAALLTLLQRWAAHARLPAWARPLLPPAARPWLRALAAPCLAAAALCQADAPIYTRIAAGWQRAIASDMNLVRNNIMMEGPSPIIFMDPVASVAPQIRFLHAQGINIFAPEAGPRPALLAALRATLAAPSPPACRGAIDAAYPIDGSAFLSFGWLAGASRGAPDWVVAIDSANTLLGAGRPLDSRADVRAALHLKADIDGFSTGFRTGQPAFTTEPGATIRFAGLFETGAPVCLLPEATHIAPPWWPDIASLQAPHPAGPSPAPATPWQETASPDAPLRAWHSCSAATLSFAVTPQPGQALALPFSAPGPALGLTITVTFADGTVTPYPVPRLWSRVIWRALVLPPAQALAHGGASRLTLRSDGTQPVSVMQPVIATVPEDWARVF